LSRSGTTGEILIADNGSTDGSQDIARANGARVVDIPTKGYGSALLGGIQSARGKYIIMGDSDDSYDFSRLEAFVDSLREGYRLVMGNRFRGGIKNGAMPLLHRYLGNPVLTAVGRLFFGSPCGDFHCGLRGFHRDSILDLDLQSPGMEFASEMVVKATINKLRIIEVPTTLSPDGRSRPPHLHTWQDGWRHLRFLLLFSPRWLFFYPGLAMITFGMVLAGVLLPGPVTIAPGVVLDVHTLLVASIAILVGTQSITFSMLARRYAASRGFLPPASPHAGAILSALTLERMLQLAALLVLLGVGAVIWAIMIWHSVDFGALHYPYVMRIMIAAATLIASGVQVGLAGFLAGIMDIPSGKHR
jgi:hypothetical protein